MTNESDIELLDFKYNSMEKKLNELKQDQKDGFAKIEELIAGLEKKFVTKEEMKSNDQKVDFIFKILFYIGSLFAAGIVGAILSVILK